jgi:hypothetical protein
MDRCAAASLRHLVSHFGRICIARLAVQAAAPAASLMEALPSVERAALAHIRRDERTRNVSHVVWGTSVQLGRGTRKARYSPWLREGSSTTHALQEHMVREQVQTRMLVAQVHAKPGSTAHEDHRVRRAKPFSQRRTSVGKGSTAPGDRRLPEGLPKRARACRPSIFAMVASFALKAPKPPRAEDRRSVLRLLRSNTTAQT